MFVGGVPQKQLILDRLAPSVAAAYGVRRLRAGYRGPLMRVRRASDNVERDIYYDVAGNLDLTDLTSFIGASSGFIVTIYDQSGNNFNATQGTSANQPRVVNAGVLDTAGGKPTMRFLAASKITVTGVPWAPSTTRNIVGFTTVTGTFARVLNAGTTDLFGFFGASNGNFTTFVGNGTTWNDVTANTPATAVTSLSVLTASNNGTTLTPFVNGTAQNTKNGATASTTGLIIGNEVPGTGQGWTGPVSEIVIYASTLSTADRKALEVDQGLYYGVTVVA